MSRHRDKRAAFVLALVLVLMFVFGQARRADAERRADGGSPADAADVAAGSLAAGSLSAGSAAVIHD